jgi:hypothetical protein
MQLIHSGTDINHWKNPGAFYIAAIVNSNFSNKEQEEFRKTVSLYDSCFGLAKQNKIPESRIKYEECCEANKITTPRLQDWIMAFYGQRLCYYHYRSGNYSDGIALTGEIMKSVRLLRQKGYQYLFFVEIQQQLNLSRIYFELNEVDKAISICTDSMFNIYRKAGSFSTDNLVNDVPENELIEATQFGMMIELLAGTCNRVLFKLKDDADILERSIGAFIVPLLPLDFCSLSSSPRYECINRFVSLMGGLSGDKELRDDDILFFMNSPHADKKLVDVLNYCISLIDT